MRMTCAKYLHLFAQKKSTIFAYALQVSLYFKGKSLRRELQGKRECYDLYVQQRSPLCRATEEAAPGSMLQAPQLIVVWGGLHWMRCPRPTYCAHPSIDVDFHFHCGWNFHCFQALARSASALKDSPDPGRTPEMFAKSTFPLPPQWHNPGELCCCFLPSPAP